jgi:2-amino-4-hydroxy-6-hydroxymethyldihydropteridine diphosphokinase
MPAYVGVGSNLGDPAARVRAAFGALAGLPQTQLIATSRLYRTAPFGPVPQGDFINAVAGLLTQLGAEDLPVPHPGIAERGFVLAPLLDLAPTLDIPGMGRVETLHGRLQDSGILEVIAA